VAYIGDFSHNLRVKTVVFPKTSHFLPSARENFADERVVGWSSWWMT
jgi:hypothetical protein